MESNTDALDKLLSPNSSPSQENSTKPKSKANFIARVVLHRPEGEDYDELHDEMDKRGFGRVIRGVNDVGNRVVQQKLPPGMYLFDANLPLNLDKHYTLRQAYNLVKDAVYKVMQNDVGHVQLANNPPTILVFEATDTRWGGLVDAPTPLPRRA